MATEVLLDTHLLLWAAAGSGLPEIVEAVLRDPEVTPRFSAVSIWEVAIKTGLGRSDFDADPIFSGGACWTTATSNCR